MCPSATRNPCSPKKAKIGQRSQRAGPGSGCFEGVHAGAVVAKVIEVRHLLRVAHQELQIRPVFDEDEAGDVRGKAGLVEVNAHGIGQRQMADAPARSGEGAQGPRSKLQGVVLKIVVVEYRPRPANDRVGVDVRAVGELEFIDERVAQSHNRLQVVQAERIRSPHSRNNGGDLFAAVQGRPRCIR